jgi:hypothetical protein
MLRTTLIQSAAAAFMVLLAGCGPRGTPCPATESEPLEHPFEVEPFTAIAVSGPIDVVLEQGGEQLVYVTAPEEYLEVLETQVRHGQWSIGTGMCSPSERIQVRIRLPELKGVTNNGPGTVTGRSTWMGEELKITSNGSGSIELSCDVERLDTRINGSGMVELHGTTRTFNGRTNGSGLLRASGLSTGQAQVRINGSGDMQLTVVEDLDVRINGSGSVYYLGRPRISSSVNGSGAVVPMEREVQ